MKIAFLPDAWEGYRNWQAEDRKVLKRINLLIRDCIRDAAAGIGKPEPLKHDRAGWYSRRITDEHRLIYRVAGLGETSVVEIAQCRHHY